MAAQPPRTDAVHPRPNGKSLVVSSIKLYDSDVAFLAMLQRSCGLSRSEIIRKMIRYWKRVVEKDPGRVREICSGIKEVNGNGNDQADLRAINTYSLLVEEAEKAGVPVDVLVDMLLNIWRGMNELHELLSDFVKGRMNGRYGIEKLLLLYIVSNMVDGVVREAKRGGPITL